MSSSCWWKYFYFVCNIATISCNPLQKRPNVKLFEKVDTNGEYIIDVENNSDGDPEYEELSEESSDNQQDLEDIDFEDGDSQTSIYKRKDYLKLKIIFSPENVQTMSCNIITHSPCSRGKARIAEISQECLNQSEDEDMIHLIVVNTNIYISKEMYYLLMKQKAQLLQKTREFVGFLYISGVLSSGRMNLEEFWTSNGTCCRNLPVTIRINRFRFL